jgi:DivIVA domain-containing protein
LAVRWHNGGVDTPFPLAEKGVPGYDKDQVSAFLARAKEVFEGSGTSLSSSDIRATVFPLVSSDGFNTRAVDEALWRLEEAFADKERLEATKEQGEEEYYRGIRERAQEILDRVARPSGEKFRGVTLIRPGYHRGDVDELCDRVALYFQQQQSLSVAAVRTASFRTALGGYDEAQVDALLDHTISVMLAVR